MAFWNEPVTIESWEIRPVVRNFRIGYGLPYNRAMDVVAFVRRARALGPQKYLSKSRLDRRNCLSGVAFQKSKAIGEFVFVLAVYLTRLSR